MTVLVVEDDMTTSMVLGYACRQAGHQVATCSDAELAWERLRSQPFELLILDLHLPGMSGVELSRLVRSLPSEQQPYILLVTGSTDPQEIRAALDAGANDFLSKPLDPGILGIRLAVAREQARSWHERLIKSTESEARERERLQTLRNLSEERLLLALSDARMATWDVDLGSKLAWCSDDGLAMYGRPPGHVYRSREEWAEEIHPDDRAEVLKTYLSASMGQMPYDIEFRCNWKDEKNIRWLSSHGAFIRNAEGKPVRLMGVMQDITERKKAALALGESEERLRLALNAARMGTWELNLLTGQGAYSDLIGPMFGKPPGFQHASFEESLRDVHPDDHSMLRERYQTALLGGERYEVTYRALLESGSVRWINSLGSVLQDSAGRAVRMIGISHELTDVKNAQEALRISESRLRHYIESTQDGLWVRNLETHEITWSDRFFQILGYRPGEFKLVHPDIFDLFHPGDRERIAYALNDHIKNNTPYRAEFRMRHKDGHYLWVYSRGQAHRDAQGRPISMMGSISDISELKEAQEALRQNEERLRLFFEATQDGLWEQNLNTGEVFWSDRVFEILGFQKNEIRPNFDHFKEQLHPEDLSPFLQAVDGTLKDSQTFRVEARIKRKDGRLLWVLMRGRAYRDAQGVPVRMIGALSDISARKKVEEQLRASEYRYRTLTENAPEAVLVLDMDTGRFVDQNAAAERLFKCTPEELSKIGPVDLSPALQPDGLPSHEKAMVKLREAVRGGSPFFDWTHQDLSGTPIPCEVRLLRMPDPSRVLIRGTITDISERKRLEDQLRQALKMEAIGKLAGGIAHDFNNLLMVIQGHIEFLGERIGKTDPMHKNLEPIAQASHRAAELTRQLLAFSRQTVLKAEVLDLNKIVTDAGNMLRRLIGEDIEFRTVCSPGLGLIKADATQIHQVIMNLAVNARDAMPNGGKLSIETANVEFDADYTRRHLGSRAGPYVMLGVTDTGHGMDAQTKARIFEPFFTTKPRGQGTGLGLAMTYGFVKQSGGYIWVNSELGQGSSFRVYFPRVDEQINPSPLATSKVKLLRGTETILLVEDEDPVRELVRDILDLHGYKVLEAPHGMAALAICETFNDPIEMMITDVIMPGMSGSQLAAKALLLRPTMKVLYTSGYTDDAIAQHGVLDPGTEFVQKPYSAELLAKKIRKILDGGKNK